MDLHAMPVYFTLPITPVTHSLQETIIKITRKHQAQPAEATTHHKQSLTIHIHPQYITKS